MSDRTTAIIHATTQMSSTLTQRSHGSTLPAMTSGSQALCDALLALGEPPAGPVKAERLAAALVLLGVVDDDVVADLEAVPAPIRAVFDAAS
jgi:hypothetical protein